MPKIKTNRGAAKRFKKTATGRFRRSQAFLNHMLTKKSTKRKRHLRAELTVQPANEKALRRMLPYI